MRDTLNNSLWNFDYTPQPPVPTQQTKKELLVFAVYINVESRSAHKSRETFSNIRRNIKETFGDVESQTNYLIKFLFFPVKDQETKIVCVFPLSEIPPISKGLLNDIKSIIEDDNLDIESLLNCESDEEDEEDWFNENKTKDIDEVDEWKKEWLNDFRNNKKI